MGHGLEKMINRGKKLAIQVSEGKKRPDVPLQAAKLASETGVALRENLPIYTSWKKYDNEAGQEEVKKVLRKVAVRHLINSNYFLALLLSHVKIVYTKSFVCGCSLGWMWTLTTKDQALMHALISLRGE